MSTLTMTLSPSELYLSIRGIQYVFHEAVADLVDNSIDAEATVVYIKTSKEEIVIADNGYGMSTEELQTAITPWAAGSRKRRGQRGKFGIGLKSASYSLGDCLEIHTQKKNGKFEFITLDKTKIENITKKNYEFTTLNQTSDLFKTHCKNNHGTILRITKVNSRKVIPSSIDSLRNLLGLIYFQPLENGEIKILINNEPVKPIDPLMRGLKKNQSKNQYELFDKKTIHVTDESSGEKAVFKVQGAYVGRGAFWTEEDRNTYKYFLKRNPKPEDNLKIGLLKMDDQGLYILRNGRFITLGGWHGIVSDNTISHHNSATRVLIEFDEHGDDMMGLDNTKTQLKMAQALKDKMQQIISEIRAEGEKRFRAEGEKLKKVKAKEEDSKALKAEKNYRKDDAMKQYQLEKQRELTIPEFDVKQKEIEDEIKAEAENTQELIEIKEKLPYNNLWSYEINKEKEILLLLNESHPAYEALFLEDDEVKIQKNLKYLFYTLATHEASIRDLHKELKPAALDDLEKAFKTFRRWVSKHFTEF